MHVNTDLQKLEAGQKILGGHCQKMGVASLVTGIKNWLYLKNEQKEETDFLYAGTNSGKLNVDSIIFGWVWSKMAMAF